MAAQRRSSLEMLPEEKWLAELRRRRPFTAAIISLRQCRKTAYMFQPLHGRSPPEDRWQDAIESVQGKIEKINRNQGKYKRANSSIELQM